MIKLTKADLELLIEQKLDEFTEDLGKRAVVLSGLPAAGKSYFINNLIDKYIDGFSGYKVANSDNQVKALQYSTARSHYDFLHKKLSNLSDDQQISIELSKFREKTKYKSNRGKMIVLPITLDWWKQNGNKGLSIFWKSFYKPYYATYFDIRDLAKEIDKQLFKTKIVKAGNILVIDTVGAKPNKLLKRLQQTKDNGYTNIIIYLEVDPELSIIRDKYREKMQGRGVGEKVIMDYAAKLNDAINIYKQNGQDMNGIVDRLLHFKWIPTGDSPISGKWQLISDDRYSIKRKLKQRRNK